MSKNASKFISVKPKFILHDKDLEMDFLLILLFKGEGLLNKNVRYFFIYYKLYNNCYFPITGNFLYLLSKKLFVKHLFVVVNLIPLFQVLSTFVYKSQLLWCKFRNLHIPVLSNFQYLASPLPFITFLSSSTLHLEFPS